MSESKADNSEVRTKISEGVLTRYLMRTTPAKLFVHGVVCLFVMPLLMSLSISLSSSVDFETAFDMTLEGGEHLLYADGPSEPANPLRWLLRWTSELLARLLSIVGVALPAWAAARLIAEAVRESRDPDSP